jgi:hypothetical protein
MNARSHCHWRSRNAAHLPVIIAVESRSQRTDLPTRLIRAGAWGMPSAALCSNGRADDWAANPHRRGRTRGVTVPPCHGHGTQRVSRSREKAPRNPTLAHSVEREGAGQAPVHYARDAPTSGSMVTGRTLNDRPPSQGSIDAPHPDVYKPALVATPNDAPGRPSACELGYSEAGELA